MKTSFAVAVLLGLVLNPTKTNAVSRHHHRIAPHSHQYIQSRDIDELDMAQEDEESRSGDNYEMENAAEAETERQEKLAQKSNRVHLIQEGRRDFYEGEENEEDDQYLQQSQLIREEEDEDEREREESSEDESDSEQEEDEDQENVQVSDDDDDEAPQQSAAQVDRITEHTYFFAGDTNVTPEGKEYTRKFPDGFDEDSPNKFVHHVLKEYALEEKDDKGSATGNFFMNKKWTQAASREVLQKQKKMDDTAADKYMNQYFGRTWEHFDVNDANRLDALDMPAFMKYLCSDQSLDLDAI